MKQISTILFNLLFFNVFAQNNFVDSLTTLLNTSNNEFEIAKINLQLSKYYEGINLQKGKDLAHKTLLFSDNDSLMAEASNQLERFHFLMCELYSAAFYF